MVTLREITDKDITPLAEFLSKGFPFTVEKGYPYTTKEFWLSMFEYWWALNPAYTDQFPRGWVLEQESAPVGFIGNIPVKFVFCGEVRIAAASNHWYVDPSVRGLSSFRLFDAFVKQKGASLFLFKAGDEPFLNIMSKFRFVKYILPRSQKEYVYILNKKKVDFVFTNFLVNVRFSRLSEFFELYRRFGFLLYAYVFQKPLGPGGILPDEEYTTSLCTSCDDAFSRLWEPYLNPQVITLSRDVKTLNWLYFSQARLSERVVIQCRRSRDNTLAGYMVFDIQRVRSSDEGILQLMDGCIENNDPKVLTSILLFAIELGKQKNVSMMVVWADNQETETYLRSMFTVRRTAQYPRYFRFPSEMKSAKDLYNKVCPTVIYPPQ